MFVRRRGEDPGAVLHAAMHLAVRGSQDIPGAVLENPSLHRIPRVPRADILTAPRRLFYERVLFVAHC